jgi:hypothetical protein
MIWTFDNQTSRWRASTVENTAVQTNFYSVETESGANDEIEAMLAKIESAAATGYEMLLANQIPKGKVKADFSMFLATLHLRTPAMINATAAAHAEMLDLTLDTRFRSREAYEALVGKMEQTTGRRLDTTYEEMRDFITDKSKYHLAVTHKLGLRIIGAADEIADLLFQRGWFICHANEGFLVTSDHPVFRWAPLEARHPVYGDGGFNNSRAEITFPLSPDKLLLITGGEEQARDKHKIAQLDRGAVDGANDMRAFAAERYVYSPVRSDAIAQQALKHKDELNRVLIEYPGERPTVKVVRRIDD